MATLEPVDHDPFAGPALVPVDHDPFAAPRSALDTSDMDDTRDTIQRRPLDARALIESGAVRVTHPGDGSGGFTQSDDPERYSIVTKWNDLHGGTADWPSKPVSHESAIQALASAHSPGPGPLYNGKYNQILWSAANSGISPFLVSPQNADMERDTGDYLGRRGQR